MLNPILLEELKPVFRQRMSLYEYTKKIFIFSGFWSLFRGSRVSFSFYYGLVETYLRIRCIVTKSGIGGNLYAAYCKIYLC